MASQTARHSSFRNRADSLKQSTELVFVLSDAPLSAVYVLAASHRYLARITRTVDKMASTPSSPLHRRQSSNFSFSSKTSSRRLSQSHSLSRRSSAAFGSPTHSRLGSSHGHGDSLAQELGGEGFGESLADELDGWSGEEDEVEEGDYAVGGQVGRTGDQERDSGIDVASSPPGGKHLSPPQANKGHRRNESAAYDGSEYGSESDLEESELVSATLEARMASIEAMARRGLEENGSEGDKIVARVTERLRDLGSQSDFEMGTTR